MGVDSAIASRLAALEQGITDLEAMPRPMFFRGWWDDLFGDQLPDEYTQALNNGNILAIDGKHGGWAQFLAGVNNGNYAILVLGDFGGPPYYYTLDVDEGWELIWRMELGHTANIQAGALAYEWVNQYRIFGGIRTDLHATNWVIECWNAAGNSFTDTGVAADTDPHVHRLAAHPEGIGYQVEYFLDNVLIGQHTTNVYAGFMFPVVWILNRGGAGSNRTMDLDFLKVLPRLAV